MKYLKVALICMLAVLFASPAFGLPVERLAYQKFIDKAAAAGGTSYACTFKIFDAATGGNQLWTESGACTATREPMNVGGTTGSYIALIRWSLGSVTPFPTTIDFQTPYYVELTITTAPAKTYARDQIGGSAYALGGIQWLGNFNIATTYQTNDVVAYNGSSYIAIVNNFSGQPPTDAAHWAVFATEGPTGATGATGAQGPQGPKGDTGATGATGAQGPIGLTGATGSQGPQGPAGADGAPGAAGTNGTNGLNGSTVLNGAADPQATDGADGDFFINTTSNTIFGPKAAGVWPATGTSLVGPQGPAGADGANGSAGATGPQGPKGDTGATGAQGPAGTAGATGPQGPQGPAGATGATGLQGPQGPQGPAGPSGTSLWTDGTGVVSTTQKVGIGTASPANKLSISDNTSGVPIQFSVSNSNSGGRANFNMSNDLGSYIGVQMSGSAYVTPSLYNTAWFMTQGNIAAFNISTNDEVASGGATPINFMAGGYGVTPQVTITPGGNVGIGTTTPAYPLQMASGARVTTGGVWTNASSRDYKENIEELTVAEAVDAVAKLDPVKYNYKVDREDKHVGFIAEDVPDLVATKDRKGLSPMDVVAVLTKVVQEQQKTIAALSREVEGLKKVLGTRD